MLLSCLAAAMLFTGCTRVVGGIAFMPPTEGSYRDGMDVDDLLLTTAELRDLTGAGLDLNGVPGMDSTQTVDDQLLVDAAPPECRFVFLESQVFGGNVKQFHKTSFQTPSKAALLSEAAAAYVDADSARRAFGTVTDLVKACGDSTTGYAYVNKYTADAEAVHAEDMGDCGRVYRLADTVLVEVTYCGYSHVVPDIVASRMASRVHRR
jgi:hypothetical protein